MPSTHSMPNIVYTQCVFIFSRMGAYPEKKVVCLLLLCYACIFANNYFNEVTL